MTLGVYRGSDQLQHPQNTVLARTDHHGLVSGGEGLGLEAMRQLAES